MESKKKKIQRYILNPLPVALKLIEMSGIEKDDMVLDLFRVAGAIYNHLPECKKYWAEILEGQDLSITTIRQYHRLEFPILRQYRLAHLLYKTKP